MSAESQRTIRKMVAEHPQKYLNRFTELQSLHSPDYFEKVDSSRYAPPYPGIPDYGCAGCHYSLPWHTSFHIKGAQGRSTVVDAHDCFGPEPTTERGKSVTTNFFSQLLDLVKPAY